jgi:outer membrane biosynthesis protein TonB
MIYDTQEQERKPEVFGPRSLGIAVALHIVAFLLLYLFAMLHLKPREAVIPIDLTVVVNENLDGEENEPPPLNKPPEPPKVETPKPTPPPEPPKVEEKVEAVEQIVEKPKPKPKEEKPKEEKKPDPPKPPEKTKEELMKERMEKMRKSTTVVKPKITVKNQPSGNGKTEKQTMSEAEIKKLLNQGYKPGTTTQLAASEEQRCISLIRAAFYAKWNRPPWTADLKEMHLKVRFGDNGRVLGYQMEKSSGDTKADATVLQAAALVPSVAGLSLDFLTKNPTVTIRFKVTPQ